MRGPQGLGRGPAAHYGGNIALRGTLGDRDHVHSRAPQHPEEAPGHAGNSDHAVADQRQNIDAIGASHLAHLAQAHFLGKGVAGDLRRQLRVRLRYCECYRMLRTGLGNQQHRHLNFAQGAEKPIRGTGHADHAGALKAQHRDVLDHGDALDRLVAVAFLRDQRTTQLRLEAAAYPYRNALAYHRTHGLRVNHAGAEIGQLHGLVIGQLADHMGFRHSRGIGAHYPFHVGPYGQGLGVHQGAEYGCGKIAAVASQSHLQAASIACDIAGNDTHGRGIVLEQPRQALAGSVPIHHHAQLSGLHPQYVAGIQRLCRPAVPDAALGNECRQQACRPQFSATRHQCLHAWPGGADQHRRVENVRHVAALRFLMGQQLCPACRV